MVLKTYLFLCLVGLLFLTSAQEPAPAPEMQDPAPETAPENAPEPKPQTPGPSVEPLVPLEPAHEAPKAPEIPTPSGGTPTPKDISTVSSFPGMTNEIIETTVNGPIELIHRVSEHVLILVTNSSKGRTLYRSTDSGMTWSDLTSKFQNVNSLEPRLVQYGRGVGICGIVWSFADASVGYISTYGGYLYTTRDGGATFTETKPTIEYEDDEKTLEIIFWVKLIPHPTVPGTVVAISLPLICLENNVMCPLTNPVAGGYALSYSTDFGDTWKNMWATGLSIPEFTFANAGKSGNPADTAFAISTINNQQYLVKSTNWFEESEIFSPVSVNIFTDMTYDEQTQTIILAGYDDNLLPAIFTYSLTSDDFSTAFFPVDTVTQSGSIERLNIVDVTNGTIYVVIERTKSETAGDLFVSDILGNHFSISLHGMIWDQRPGFTEIDHIEGIDLANQQVGDKEISVITFNNGGLWTPINPPESEIVDGVLEPQNLQFWGPNAMSGASVQEAHYGIVVGMASVGASVNPDPEMANLYLSRDAGHTWSRIKDGSYLFDVSDYAELIVASAWKSQTKRISYTLNQGLTWNEVLFSDPTDNTTSILVNGVHILSNARDSSSRWNPTVSPLDFTNPTILVEGVYIGDSEPQHVLFWVNLSQSLPSCTDDDYETFYPRGEPDTLSSACVLGRKTTYTRQKQTSICRLNPEVVGTVSQNSCVCTRADYMCTFCFIPDADNNCVLDVANPTCDSDPGVPPNCAPGSTFNVFSQYRKIIGTSCSGGDLNLERNRTASCIYEVEGEAALQPGIIALIIIVIVVVLIGFIFGIVRFVQSNQRSRFDGDGMGDMETAQEELPVGDL